MTGLILGTAQFGAGYGITNTVGRISDESIRAILACASGAGIDLFDTAPDYGDAQFRLGVQASSGADRRFVSKFSVSSAPDGVTDKSRLYGSSMDALRVSTLYGLLFHRVDDLRDPLSTGVWASLQKARSEGEVSRIGASIYDVDDLELVAQRFPDLNVIQVPGSILDRRLLDHPTLRSLHDSGVEVHVRSAYLQGLILADPESFPEYFADLRPVIHRLRAEAEVQHTSAMGLALGFLQSHSVVDSVIVGATTAEELSSTVSMWDSRKNTDSAFEVDRLRPEILDPRLWPQRTESR